MPKVIISGFGLITPLGDGAWATFASLLSGRSIADRCEPLPENIEMVDLVRAVGSVSSAQHTSSDVAVELAERAAREAIFMSGANEPLDANLGVSKGAVHVLSDAANRFHLRAGLRSEVTSGKGAIMLSYQSSGRPGSLSPASPADRALAVTLGPHGYLSHHLQQRLKLGNISSTVAACASSLTALHQARMRLIYEPTGPDRILVLTSEAALISGFVHSYVRLGVLPPLTTADYRGRPLDETRAGFMLSEIGAAVVLQRVSDDASLPRGAVELVDTAIAADAYDLVQPCAEMPALRHITHRLLGGRSIDLLHPHATGTREHDAAELAVYEPFANANTDVFANKGAIGHGLGAAGLASLVIACLCARANKRPPMSWLDRPISSTLHLSREPRRGAAIVTQGIFSAGFAGHVAGALIRSH